MTKAIRQEFARLANDYVASKTAENKFAGDSEKLTACITYFEQQTPAMRTRFISDINMAAIVATKKQEQQQTYATTSHTIPTDADSLRHMKNLSLWGASLIPSAYAAYTKSIPSLDNTLIAMVAGMFLGAMASRYFPNSNSELAYFAREMQALAKTLTTLQSQPAAAKNAMPEETKNETGSASPNLKK
jgi:hypothetical protein